MENLFVMLPYCNVSPKGRRVYKSDGWVFLTDENPTFADTNNIRVLRRNKDGLYFVETTNSNRFTGDLDGNRFEITINDDTISFKHIKAEGAPIFKCHTRLDGLTLVRKIRRKSEDLNDI